MATAMVLSQTETATPRGVRRCPEWDAQRAVSSAPASAARRCVERDVQHADIPVLFSIW